MRKKRIEEIDIGKRRDKRVKVEARQCDYEDTDIKECRIISDLTGFYSLLEATYKK